jgi:transposase
MYTWMPKASEPTQVMRPGGQRYNAIAAQWNREVYFSIKTVTTTKSQYCEFLKSLNRRLQTRLTKLQYECRTVLIFDNASIHTAKDVSQLIRKMKLKAFTVPQYSPQLNEIEHTFGQIKTKLSRRNMNGKTFLTLIKEEIKNVK